MTVADLADGYVTELLARQDALQREAEAVIAALSVREHLARAGRVEQVGSSVSRLMVWRDLDFCVIGPKMTAERAFDAIAPIVTHPRTLACTYANEIGPRSPTGTEADQRYYFVLRHETPAGDTWKIDVTFWLLEGPRGQLAHVEELRRRLTDETRLIVLWLKDLWHRLPVYPDEVGGTDIYDAVLNHAVRTPDQLDAYLRERGMPTHLGPSR